MRSSRRWPRRFPCYLPFPWCRSERCSGCRHQSVSRQEDPDRRGPGRTRGTGRRSRRIGTTTVQQLEGRAVERPSRVGVRVPQRPPPALGREGDEPETARRGGIRRPDQGRNRGHGGTTDQAGGGAHQATPPDRRGGSRGDENAVGAKSFRITHRGAHVRPHDGAPFRGSCLFDDWPRLD